MPFIRVDGREIEVPAGRTLLQALDDVGLLMNGIEIPHYCWHPKLAIDGSCRLCQVEIEGTPKLQIACNTPVRDGMVVTTQGPRVQAAREGVMELLLVNHPLDCPICDQAGECKLQDYAYDYGLTQSRSREPRRALKKNVDLGPTIVFDQERCILCRRCVRFCEEITGTRELRVFGRGDRSVVDTWPGVPLDNPYSMNVADLCPVGALTTKDFRFRIRVWFLEEVPGICTGCANGCNVYLGVANNKVYRYTPRRNDAVNQTWICDAGRLSYQRIGAPDRQRSALVRGELGLPEVASFERALAEAAGRLRRLVEAKGPGVVAGVASAHATNEDLYTFRRFLRALGAGESGVAVPRGGSDALLVKAEKAANAAGARALGFGEAAAVVERLRAGGVQALVVLGSDLLGESALGDLSLLAGLDTLVALEAYQSDLQRVAHVVFPTRHAAEKQGTLTNFSGRVQRVVPAVEPAFEAWSEGEVLHRLGAALGLPGFEGGYDPRAVFRALAREVPAFAGLDEAELGDQGAPLAAAPAGRPRAAGASPGAPA
jgi:NADH-quinone oxidoreductase subunit G